MNKEEKFKKYSLIIEATLASFGIAVRIAKVNDYKNCIQYCLELALGTSVKRILNLDKDIALALESPTGRIEIEAPMPHSNLIGITVPKNEKYNKRNLGELLHSYRWTIEQRKPWSIKQTDTKPVDGWKGKISNFLYVLGYLIIGLSNKINQKQQKRVI